MPMNTDRFGTYLQRTFENHSPTNISTPSLIVCLNFQFENWKRKTSFQIFKYLYLSTLNEFLAYQLYWVTSHSLWWGLIEVIQKPILAASPVVSWLEPKSKLLKSSVLPDLEVLSYSVHRYGTVTYITLRDWDFWNVLHFVLSLSPSRKIS